MNAAGKLVVTLRRSAIGASRTQLATLNALGLKKKIGRTIERDSELQSLTATLTLNISHCAGLDNAGARGMVLKVFLSLLGITTHHLSVSLFLSRQVKHLVDVKLVKP